MPLANAGGIRLPLFCFRSLLFIHYWFFSLCFRALQTKITILSIKKKRSPRPRDYWFCSVAESAQTVTSKMLLRSIIDSCLSTRHGFIRGACRVRFARYRNWFKVTTENTWYAKRRQTKDQGNGLNTNQCWRNFPTSHSNYSFCAQRRALIGCHCPSVLIGHLFIVTSSSTRRIYRRIVWLFPGLRRHTLK